MAIDAEVLDGLFDVLALVTGPVIGLLGFGTIRHEVRLRGAWRPAVVRGLTVVMWSAAIGPGVALLLGANRVAAAIVIASLAAFLLSDRLVRVIAGPPNARLAAAQAVHRVLTEFNTLYEPEDAEAIRTHLAELDEVVTTETFEFVQLTRAYILHILDGGSPRDPNAVRWRGRLDEIAGGWWRGRATADDPGRRLSLLAARRESALGFIGGIALGAGIWSGVGVAQVVASVVVGWLVMFVFRGRMLATVLGGAAVGLLTAFGLEIATCTACDWTATATPVALLAVALLLIAWYADTREPPAAIRPLTVIQPTTVGPLDDDAHPGGPPPS